MTLYLKYRPQTLEELDSESVRESLKKIVSSGKIPQAFLFSGPKGIGKTSAARILAKIIDCEKNGKKLKEPCNRCEQCITISKGSNLDVVELDAASNRGIEDVRNLRDAVKLSPARAKKKVYIIDEAHMLTTEASNALLKTLEEPPEHVMFILATTNPEKLVETIRSRTTNIVFSKAKPEELLRSLQRVVKGEKLKLDKESLSLIARAAGGSFRDAVKLVEQIILEKIKTDTTSIQEFVFKRRAFTTDEFLELLYKKDVKGVINEVERVSETGLGMETFLEDVLVSLRQELLAKLGVGVGEGTLFKKEELIELVTLFSQAARELSGSLLEQIPVELAIISWCQELAQPNPVLSNANSSEEGKKEDSTRKKNVSLHEKPNISIPTNLKEVSEEIWRNILAAVKPRNTTIEALLRAARPIGYDGKVLTLGVFYRFHKERLEEGQNRRILEETIEMIFGAPVRVVCTLTEPPARKVEEKPKETVLTEGEDKDIIKVAEEIFGS